jgi:choline-glycine betaine transporter
MLKTISIIAAFPLAIIMLVIAAGFFKEISARREGKPDA